MFDGRASRPALRPLIIALGRREIDEKASIGLSTDWVLRRLEDLEAELGTDKVAKVIADISRRENFWEAYEKLKTGRIFNRVARALALIPEVDRNRLVTNVRTRLDAVDAAGWRDAIAEDLATSELARLYRADLGQTKALGNEVKEALTTYRPELAAAPAAARERWFALTAYLTPNSRETLFKILCDALLAGSDVNDLPSLLRAGGMNLLDTGGFAEEPDKVVRHILLNLVRDAPGREILSEFGDFFAAVVAKSKKDSKAALAEELDTAAADEGQADAIAALRATLKFPGAKLTVQ